MTDIAIKQSMKSGSPADGSVQYSVITKYVMGFCANITHDFNKVYNYSF